MIKTLINTDEQKNKWLPKLISGTSVAALAMTEPGAGSDLQAIKTSAKRDCNQYKLNGSKIFITNGGTADLVVVAAKTDQEAGAKGISLILLDTNEAEGFSRGTPLKKLGLKGNDTAELFFDDIKINMAFLDTRIKRTNTILSNQTAKLQVFSVII